MAFGYGGDGVPWLESDVRPVQGAGGNWFETGFRQVLGVATEVAKFKAQWEQAERGYQPNFAQGATHAPNAYPNSEQELPVQEVGGSDFAAYKANIKEHWLMYTAGGVLLLVGGLMLKGAKG